MIGIATNTLSYTIEQQSEDGKYYEAVIVNSKNELAAEGWDVKAGTRLIRLPSGKYSLQAMYKKPKKG